MNSFLLETGNTNMVLLCAVQGKRNLLWRFNPEGAPLEVQQLSQMLPDKVAGEGTLAAAW
jgi:hypothetical protein